LRWLVSDVPGPIRVATNTQRAAPGEPVEIVADVRDSGFHRVNDAAVVARIESPTGAAEQLPLAWSIARDGEFRGSFTPTEAGAYRVVVEAARGEEVLSADTVHVQATDGDD